MGRGGEKKGKEWKMRGEVELRKPGKTGWTNKLLTSSSLPPPHPSPSLVLAGEALVCSHTLLLTVGNARCLHCSLAQETVQNGAYTDLSKRQQSRDECQ